MTKLILSTSNVMNGGPSIIRRPLSEKSNVELVNGLRSNILTSKNAFQPTTVESSPTSWQKTNGNSATPPYSEWTCRENGSLFVPAVDFAQTGLAEERSQYDITVKLFFLPGTSPSERCKHAQEAMDLVLRELHMPSVDLLIVSFPGVSFDADDDDDDQNDNSEGQDISAMTKTWKALECLHDKGMAQQIGLSEFGTERLKRFLPTTRIKPSVDQINVKDCCVVPKPLILYARHEKIELLTHNDCTNILPSGTIRELLGAGERGAGVLVANGDATDDDNSLHGDIKPQWVVKYTAVVRDRGVIEYKGYFAMAEIQS